MSEVEKDGGAMDLHALTDKPHRRFNPLTGDWVLVSPHRTDRPWQGYVENSRPTASVSYDPGCYLCPGNERAGGKRNPGYTSTFVFTNDFPALVPSASTCRYDLQDRGLLVADGESGTCRVLCLSPRHDASLSRMSVEEITAIVDLWVEQFRELSEKPNINSVQIFENRGQMMGCSNPHPHCQIWANEAIPNEPRIEQQLQAAYELQHGRCLLCEYLRLELSEGKRIVCQNAYFAAVVSFWAIWPFETIVISKSHIPDLVSADGPMRCALADVLKRLVTRYDNLFATEFPYSMGFHQAPTDGLHHSEWHLHAHFYPPLLRSASIRKFMVGYEMLATPQRDLTAEEAAARLVLGRS